MLRKIIGVLAALSLMVPASGNAVDPAAGASENVEHVLNVPVGTMVGGVFAGDHYYASVARGGSFLPGGVSTGGIYAFDVTDPRRPVPTGFLPLPHWQNEDIEVSTKRNLMLVVNDRRKSVGQVATSPIIGGILFVIDISNRAQPMLISTLQLPAEVAKTSDGVPLGGPGHTASCIADCSFAWLGGSRDRGVTVVDLRDPAAPALLGVIPTPAGADNVGYGSPGVVHDVHMDRYRNVWVAGSGGTAMYELTKNPLKPKLIAATHKSDNARLNGLIHHGVQRFNKDLVLIGEEDYGDSACGTVDPKNQDGSMQIWKIDRKAKRLRPVSTWDVALDGTMETLATEVGITCSSHWFDYNRHSIVVDGWYEAGVRFLDVSKPAKMRQVGYFIGTGTAASGAKFHPKDPSVVYVADYNRGLDVIAIDHGGHKAKTVTVPAATIRAAHSGIRFALEPDPEFGYACLRVPGL